VDAAVPIVFPDYRITIEVNRRKVDLIPGTTFDDFYTPAYRDRVSNLGHAGVLFIHGKTGTTKYYEYGRYDPPRNRGLVVKARNLPDVTVRGATITLSSMKGTLSALSRRSGKVERIEGVYIEVDEKYAAMLAYAEFRRAQNADPGRRPYDVLGYNCMHFVKDVVKAAGVSTPWMIDPRPNSYVGEFRAEFPDLDYTNGVLSIEGLGSF